jgi:cytochrome c-type biogenesis protein CcmH/NrfG
VVIKIDPQNADAYYNRGLAYFDQGDYKKARADWEMALKLGLSPEQEAKVKEWLTQLPP